MKRINSRLDPAISISQAAYRKNLPTTEHLLPNKLITERTVSPTDETVYLLLLDMSKAFDSIQRNTKLRPQKCPESRQTTFDPNPARCENCSQML